MARRKTPMTVGELRKTLVRTGARWTIHPRLHDKDPLPRFHTGGTVEGLIKAKAALRVDFHKVAARGTNNPHLMENRIARGWLGAERAPPLPLKPASSPGSVSQRKVDWRDRWGWPWITAARNQNPCNTCWAFAATGLVESMTRIEHAVWAPRSEGDVLTSANAICANSGHFKLALDAIEQRGAADRDCVPWDPSSGTIVIPPATVDRSGRTVTIGDWQNIGPVDEQKDWLENVGPLVTAFYVWNDFFAHGPGVYHKTPTLTPVVDEAGWHALLVVGFDDAQQAWIVKNSWGAALWGVNGFGLIGYGECEIDTFAKAGLQGTNPDPWIKRRLHNGNLLEGDGGSLHTDFEMFATFPGHGLRHWRRRNSDDMKWHALEAFATDAVLFRPTVIQSTYSRNYELVYLTHQFRLRQYWYSQSQQQWFDGGVFGPADAAGVPGFIQSNYSAPGNFELVVRTSDARLSQWWREGGSGGTWVDGGKFASNVAFSGATLIQSQYGTRGDFFVVCVLGSGEMQEWQRLNDAGGSWVAGARFGSNVASAPCLIEGQYGAATETAVGNFELCVAVNGQVQHWWRSNWTDGSWRFGGSFGHDVFAVVGLLQSSYLFNLELIVVRYDFQLQHYFRSVSGWHEGPVVGSAG